MVVFATTRDLSGTPLGDCIALSLNVRACARARVCVVTSNRQKQEVGRRVALHALATAYHTGVNAGPQFKTVEAVGGATVVHISSSVPPPLS